MRRPFSANRAVWSGVLAACVLACGVPEPRWIEIATAGAPDVSGVEALRASEFGLPSARRVRRVVAGDAVWLSTRIPSEDWSPLAGDPGLFAAPAPLIGRVAPSDGSTSSQLLGATGPLDPVPWLTIAVGGLEAIPEGGFSVSGSTRRRGIPPNTLLLRQRGAKLRREELELRVFAGAAVGDTIIGNRFSGVGLALLSGDALEIPLSVRAGDALRFATVTEPALNSSLLSPGFVRFRVSLDGRSLYEHREPQASRPSYAWHAVPLGSEDLADATLRLEVSGALAHTSFLAPVVGPADVGEPGNRPWERSRPDVIVFLADTFRADNMEAYGSELGITPELDAFARSARLFRRAWSPATYTMAAHAVMFSGFYARQTDSTSYLKGLPEPIVTIAERLREAGYRTGAITDSAIVSARNGLAQGFSWFDEYDSTLRSTCERALDFLRSDDGRPVFLFIQTYRVHGPYHSTQSAGVFEHDVMRYRDLDARLREHERRADFDRKNDATYGEIARDLRDLYLSGVADFDREFGECHRSLGEAGWLDAANFILTSDHGEAFNEHDIVYHAGKAWEEMARIPLIVSGVGIEPGRTDFSASLIDLAPTLTDLAGIEPDPAWPGRSLLAASGDRPVFLFENRNHPDSTLAIVDGERKVFGYEDPAALVEGLRFAAFDLTRDPRERVDAEQEGWAAAMLEQYRDQLIEYVRPRWSATARALDPDRTEALRALGYLEED